MYLPKNCQFNCVASVWVTYCTSDSPTPLNATPDDPRTAANLYGSASLLLTSISAPDELDATVAECVSTATASKVDPSAPYATSTKARVPTLGARPDAVDSSTEISSEQLSVTARTSAK